MKSTFTVVWLLTFMFQGFTEFSEIHLGNTISTKSENGLKDFVMCRGLETRKIQCHRPNELIDIKSARLIYAEGKNYCASASHILREIRNGKEFSCTREEPFLSCHGQRQCVVDDRLVGSYLLCEKEFYNSNVLYIKYSCHKFDEKRTAQLILKNIRVTGETVDVVSPNFPCIIPEQEENYLIQCVIKPLKSGENTVVLVNNKLVRFQPPSGSDNNTCQEKLYGLKEGSSTFFNQCKNRHGIREVRNNKTTPIELTQEYDFFTLFYIASSEITGGIFWIQIKGERNAHAAKISVSCNNSKGLDLPSLPRIPERCKLFPQATITAELKSQQRLFQEEVFYGAIGGLIFLMCLLVFIIAILIYIIRKRKNEDKHCEEQKTASTTQSSTTQSSAEGIVCSLVTEGTGQNRETGRLTERRKVKNGIENHVDETVMFENDDLYEATDINHIDGATDGNIS